ncbi:MAG: phosphotransferase [Anaerolineae bacterium]
MNRSKLDVAQLKRRNPTAWAALLQRQPELEQVVVTAVQTRPFHASGRSFSGRLARYVLSLEGHSDPITLVGKRTNRVEALFYQTIAPQLPVAPYCWFLHLSDEGGWIVTDDVINDYAPDRWTLGNVEDAIDTLTMMHASFWNRGKALQDFGFSHFIHGRKYTWEELREENEAYLERGPAAILSEHAIHNAGRLAPVLLRATNGLAVLQSLGGWPGVMGQSHMDAAADLLDDPVPMLEPLLNLPLTLLHGDPNPYHWRMSLLDRHRLIDWRKAVIGPGVCDLISFLDQFGLLRTEDNSQPICTRDEWPADEETIVDSYMLTMSAELGADFQARMIRQALPAARCLFVITRWLPEFARWFSSMPNKYAWQKVNRMSDEQLLGTMYAPLAGFRPYLAAVFRDFLKAYRTL